MRAGSPASAHRFRSRGSAAGGRRRLNPAHPILGRCGNLRQVRRGARCAAASQGQAHPHDADAGTVGSHLTIDAPVLLDDSHDLGAFDCGVPPLDEWLKRRARDNAASGGTHTYVACEGGKVVGYYALAAGAVEVTAAPGRFRRNMPDPIPIVVLGRLAIDRSHQGKGLGRALFRDAGLRVLQAAAIIGVRGVLVDAISKDAKAFYLALGMTVSPLDPMTLMVTLADLRASLTLGLSRF